MKISVTTVVLYLSFCLIVLSCKNVRKQILFENKDTIDKILIQFYPSFNELSLIFLDLSKGQQIFQRIGQKKYYRAIPPREIIQIHAPKSLNFQIDYIMSPYFRTAG
jgi:hypothetical protein